MALPFGRSKINWILFRSRQRTGLVLESTVSDWDDIRYFLAVARVGSVRAAAEGLGVNHSTVLRRIAQLESRLGAQIFEKLPSGYRVTSAGEEVRELAERMEVSSHQLETRVSGRDQSVRGLLRVTLAPTLATRLLMADFAEFARLHPDIEMDILSSGELANLTNREADVAIRVVYDRKTLPLNLHALKGPDILGGIYISRDRLAAWRANTLQPVRWVTISSHGIPEWVREGEIPAGGVPFKATDAEAQIVAVREGIGMTTLPCFVGDADPDLARVPGTDLHLYGAVWVLTQGETRKTMRVHLFTEYVSRRLAEYAPLLAGHSRESKGDN
ncbi:LysR family transcriptional regulator [Xylophilus sp.]|uniref:LysR family transcriptional regulator n=1 Tax=Xylophilus sp. TaxID=2653893 RepID=UPI002D8092EE|nr:LysR family transcriptional regulator [Xylophilus sp.]